MGAAAEFTAEDIKRMTPDELAYARAVLAAQPVWSPLPGPQSMANDSTADVIGFGGSAGGGKTDLIVGRILTRHKRCLVIRREKAQTEGIVQRMTQLVGDTEGFNSTKGIWRVEVGSEPLVEFGGLDNPGDERRWQGRPHDLKAFDEVTEMREAQVRFIMGWLRSEDPSVRPQVLMTFNPPTTTDGRWVIKFFGPWLDNKHPNPAAPGELRWFTTIAGVDEEVPDSRSFVLVDGQRVYDFNPADFKPEEIIEPKSRTFIPARLTDNPYYMATGYMATLQGLPEPLRSQMLYGDFNAGMQDDAFQIFPTEWVEAAMARWKQPAKLEPMDSVGVDVARGGNDKTVIITRHDQWYSQPIAHPGAFTPDGPRAGALTMAAARDGARLHVDAIGVGASVVDWLRERDQPVLAVNVAESATARSKGGSFGFANLRSQLMWKLREALDPANNTGICLPDSRDLRADLAAVTWAMRGKVLAAESRDDIIKKLGRSPDYLSALMLASMDSPDLKAMEEAMRTQAGHARREHNPLDYSVPTSARREHNPFN